MKPKSQDNEKFIPYGRQYVDEKDIKAVHDVLLSDWLTTGPKVEEFEQKIAEQAGARFAGAVNSGTAALHAAMYAIDLKPGEEVVVPAITFAATANAVVYQGGTPVFVDVNPDTLLMDPQKLEEKITSKTRAITCVDYAGQMCDYDALNQIAKKNDLHLIADACHSIGGLYKGKPSGSCADLSVFSFHPVKHMTTGEGGMVVSESKDFIDRVKRFRNHGINTDFRQREEQGSWYYEIEELGFNYRLTDFQCALGITQLEKLAKSIEKRNMIAAQYDKLLSQIPQVAPLKKETHNYHAYHIYVIKLHLEEMAKTRERVFSSLREKGIGVNVHYIPVHYHPFYKKNFHTFRGMCPVAEDAYERILTIPVFPLMEEKDVQRVCEALKDSL